MATKTNIRLIAATIPLWVAAFLFIYSIAGYFLHAPDIEVPRNEEPMGDMTDRYTIKTFIASAKWLRKIELTYYWLEPDSIEEGKKYPLVLVLHGDPGNAYAAAVLAHVDKRENYPAFVVAPILAENTTWQPRPYSKKDHRPSRTAQTATLVRQLIKDNPIDPARVYVIGCSAGGHGAFAMAAYYPSIFAAAVPISGFWYTKDASRIARVPLRVMYGNYDDVVEPDLTHKTINAVIEKGGTVSEKTFENLGHDCPADDYYTDETWNWLFEQHK